MDTTPRIAHRLDRASEAMVLAVVILAPWAFGAVEAWAGFLIAAAIVGMTLLGTVSGCLAPDNRVVFATPALALVGLALLALAQAAPLPRGLSAPLPPVRVIGDPGPAVPPPAATIAQDREAAIGVASWLALAWAFFLGVFRLNQGRRVAAAMAINAAALALFAMIQALSWNGKIYWLRETPQDHAWFSGGPFVCHNHLAAYLNLGLGFALGFLMEPIRPKQGVGRGLRLGWAYVAGVITIGVIGSQSRGGTVAMVTAGALIFARGWRRSIRLGLAVIAMASIACALLNGGEALTRLATVLDPNSRGYAVRFAVWQAGLRAWLEHPWTGAGLGSFATATAPHFNRDHAVVFTHAENEPVHLLAEGGLVALLIAGAGTAALVAAAWRRTRAAGNGPLAMGALFGLLAVAIQSLGDFALHIPAVAMAALASAALLARVSNGMAPLARPRSIAAGFIHASTLVGAVLAMAHSRSLARAESALAGSGVPLAGPAFLARREPTKAELQQMATGLERALIHRPDWSEGHVRLGQTRMLLYQAQVDDWIKLAGAEEARADPLRLVELVHQGKASVTELKTQEPVVAHLIPAARSFLEARRTNPASPSAYVGLAGLHYLMEGDESPSRLLAHARKLAGADSAILGQIAEIAATLDDLDEAATCWRRILAVRDERWEEVADAAGAVLSPTEIRDSVAIGGRDSVRFADHLYAQDRGARNLLMIAALDRLPNEAGLSKAERLGLEAHAHAALGQRQEARKRIEDAIALEPARPHWREELIGWLLSQGEVSAAHRHARIGLQLCPGHEAFRKALDQTGEALATGLTTHPQLETGGEVTGDAVRPRTP